MLKIKNHIININTIDMLEYLKMDLAARGLDRFMTYRLNGDNVQTNCPFHKNGQERKPSFGINGELNKCHCFTCGWGGTIEQMISELFGYSDNGNYGVNYLIKNFSSTEISTRPNLMQVFNNERKKVIKPTKNYISEDELDKYRYYHEYMYHRGLTDEIIEEFDIGYDPIRDCITFPILDLNKNCVFVATRNVKNKFFTLPQDVDKPLYQGYRFTSGKYKECWIVESFFHCLTCWKYGIPSIALIGTGNKKQYELLSKLPIRTYILAFDPDEAGQKAIERFRKNVKNKVIKEVIYKDNRDINDLQEEIKYLKIVF